MVGFWHHQVYSGTGAGVVMESITLIEAQKGEQKAHACAIAWFQQLRFRIAVRETAMKITGETGWERCAARVISDSFNKVEIIGHPPVRDSSGKQS
jgi:hypothetical protein